LENLYDDDDVDVKIDLKSMVYDDYSMISMHLLMKHQYCYYVMVQYCQIEVVLNLLLMKNLIVVVFVVVVDQDDDDILNEILIFLLIYPNKKLKNKTKILLLLNKFLPIINSIQVLMIQFHFQFHSTLMNEYHLELEMYDQ
jgi:hypothetical protein